MRALLVVAVLMAWPPGSTEAPIETLRTPVGFPDVRVVEDTKRGVVCYVAGGGDIRTISCVKVRP